MKASQFGLALSITLGTILFLLPSSTYSQATWLPKRDSFRHQPFVMLQTWLTYTHGQQEWQADSGDYLPVADRADLQLRRARFGLKGQPYKRLRYTAVFYFDLVGRDLRSATVGGSNGPSPRLGLWDAFLQWKGTATREWLYLTVGYFRPQLGRESITSAWSVNSLEKATNQTYLRRHLVGLGPGRATGLNAGGLLTSKGPVTLGYNTGVFFPQFVGNATQSMGQQFAPLWVGRAVLHIGDPEQTRYRIAYQINYFGERKGISLGLGAAYQGETDLFENSQTLSADLLANYGPLNLDGEWSLLQRADANGNIRSQTGHLRMGVNIPVAQYVLEPSAMVMAFRGVISEDQQARADRLGASAGEEYTYDIGINWYLREKALKLALHYIWRTGDPGAAGVGSQVNGYFSQSGIGAIQRGNWLGLGLSTIF